MTAVAELVPMTFGTDESVQAVLAEIANANDLFYGVLGDEDTRTVRAAWSATDKRGKPSLNGWFNTPGTYVIMAEQTAALFESLVDYAEDDTVCDIDNDEHCPVMDGFCDCDTRNRAYSLASEIAAKYGVELI